MAFQNMYQDTIDELDAAQKVLIEEAEAKKRRKREETRVALDKIRARIDASLNGWQDASDKGDADDFMPDKDDQLDTYRDVVQVRSEDSSVEVSLDSITDPIKLYELLADVRLRSKYEKKLTVVVVQMDDLHQEKEEVLKSLNHFFEENRESNMNDFIAEIESEGVDIEDATSGIESALETATNAATRLVDIEKEIAQLISIASSYPSSKKGRKKLEKALIKAQDELQSMSITMDSAKKELEESRTNCDQLQLTLDSKSKECVKLKKAADQAKKLQLSNDSVKAELSNVSSLLKKAEDEIIELQKRPVKPAEPQIIVDDNRIKELEKELEESKMLSETIQARNEEQTIELENMKSQYEREIAEMKANHDEQLGSLVVDFDEEIEEVDAEKKDYDDVREEMKEELEEREAALQLKLTEVKNNANKIIASLKLQLSNSQNKQEQQREALEGELQAKQEESEKQTARIADLENALKRLSIELKEVSLKQGESSPMQLNLIPDKHVDASSPASPPVTAPLPTIPNMQLPTTQLSKPEYQLTDHSTQWSTAELTTHSTQWSDGVMSSNRTVSGSPQSIVSEQHPPILQMEEVQVLSPLADRSLMMSLGNSSVHHIHGSPQHSGTSPLFSAGSIVSGRALTNGEMFLVPNTTVSTSNSPEKRSISPNNPVVQEWSKAVDQIMRFKTNIIEVLTECQMLPPSIVDSLQELQEQKDPSLDKEKDISSQVTQMRFNLALVLHQLETTLKDSITVMNPDSKLNDESKDCPTPLEEENKEHESSQKKMAKEIAKLQKQLQLTEEAHKQELQKNKEAITNLSMKVGILKTELSTTKHHLSQVENQPQSSTVFFTRLDYERNRRTLEEAVSSQKITNDDFETMVSNMEDYLTLPGQRLKHIKHHAQQQAGLKKAYTHVRNHSSTPEHTSQVLTMIQHLQQQRKDTFSSNMKTLSTERLHLAGKIQNALTEVEKRAGLFLIKPMYPTKAHGTRSIMTPLNRAPPKYRVPMPTPSSRVGKREMSSSKSSRHPTLQLINNIRSELSTRQASRDQPDSRYGLSTEQSTALPTRPPSVGGPQWIVSHTPAANIDFTPVLPRLVELEVKQLRHPDSLLSQGSSITSSVVKEKDSISRSLIRDGKLLHPIKGSITSGVPHPPSAPVVPAVSTALPPIQIPSHYPQQQSVI